LINRDCCYAFTDISIIADGKMLAAQT